MLWEHKLTGECSHSSCSVFQNFHENSICSLWSSKVNSLSSPFITSTACASLGLQCGGGGVLCIMAYTGRLRPRVPFSGFSLFVKHYMKMRTRLPNVGM